MSPLPNINQAYAMVISDEGQKAVGSITGSLGINIMLSDGLNTIAMYSKFSKTGSGSGSDMNHTQRFKNTLV